MRNPVFSLTDFPEEYAKYNTQYLRGGEMEVIDWMLWDTVTYTSGTTVQATFFTNTRATVDLGNMELAGQLAAPKGFLVRAFRFYVKQRPRSLARAAAGAVQPGAIDNIQQLTNTGVLEFTIGNKEYGTFPLYELPSGGGAYGLIASDGDVADPGEIQDFATSGVPDPRNAFALSDPLFIQPAINFRADITWPAALTLAGGNTTITLAMDGDLVRPLQ
jgi:hypothetical protein